MKIRIKRRPGKFMTLLIIASLVFFTVKMFTDGSLEQIEDTNGPDDYSLVTITDEQIANERKSTPTVLMSRGLLSNKVDFTSNKFSGVYLIAHIYSLLESSYEVDLLEFEVTEGNFKMVVVNEGKIVATIEPGQTEPVCVENVKGDLSLVIAGESAAFHFSMFVSDFELIGGTVD